MRVLRSLSAVLLALTLAVTGAAMAVARGQTSAGAMIIICTGAGPVSVQVDKNGQPVGPAHICPDCALSLFDATADPGVRVEIPAQSAAQQNRSLRTASTRPAARALPPARAPPVV